MLQFFLQKCRKSLLLRNPLQRRFCAKISVCSFLCRASAAHPADYQLIASTGSGREKTAVIAAPRARRDPRSNVYIWRFRNEWRLAISPASPRCGHDGGVFPAALPGVSPSISTADAISQSRIVFNGWSACIRGQLRRYEWFFLN